MSHGWETQCLPARNDTYGAHHNTLWHKLGNTVCYRRWSAVRLTNKWQYADIQTKHSRSSKEVRCPASARIPTDSFHCRSLSTHTKTSRLQKDGQRRETTRRSWYVQCIMGSARQLLYYAKPKWTLRKLALSTILEQMFVLKLICGRMEKGRHVYPLMCISIFKWCLFILYAFSCFSYSNARDMIIFFCGL